MRQTLRRSTKQQMLKVLKWMGFRVMKSLMSSNMKVTKRIQKRHNSPQLRQKRKMSFRRKMTPKVRRRVVTKMTMMIVTMTTIMTMRMAKVKVKVMVMVMAKMMRWKSQRTMKYYCPRKMILKLKIRRCHLMRLMSVCLYDNIQKTSPLICGLTQIQ